MLAIPLNVFTEDESFPFFIQFGFHDEPLYLHSHLDFSELVIVMEGEAEHIVDNDSYLIRKGDVFVINNDTEHGYDNTKEFRICNIMFKPDYFLAPELDIAQSAGFQALFVLEPHCARTSKFCSRLKLGVNEFAQTHRIIQSLHQEYNTQQSGWKTVVKSDFLKLVICLARLYNCEKIAEDAGVIKLANAIAYMEKNYDMEISISQLAAMSHYSERQFVRLFKDAFSCIPMAYLTNLRMQKARELLKVHKLSITEIAIRCGYADSNYFSRIFKKYNGVTPTVYRESF